MPQEHISKQYDADLENIRTRVLQMGGLVEEQILNSVEALTTGNLELINQVIEGDHRVNAMEVQLDEDCQHIIVRRQPAAGDMRMVMAVVKTITDLERIGDEASKIARMSKQIYESERLHLPRFGEVRHLASLGVDMLRDALDAFARLDTVLAAQVVKRDQQLDDEFRSVFRLLVTHMMEDPRTITIALDTLFVAKAIERIGDHAKNMSEYVIFLVKGKDVRHLAYEILEREALN